jgi:hypothetical protein
MFLWGEDFEGLRIRKPKLFYDFGDPLVSVSFGKHHGIAIDSNLMQS